jgi:low affinity Fe/Cu permease
MEAVHLQLDELLRVTDGAHVALLDLEELNDKELDRLQECYVELAAQARERIRRGEDDTGIFDVETPVVGET